MTTHPFMSDDISKLVEALAKAKTSFKPIHKNKTVKTKTYSFDYADQSSIEAATMTSLSEQGLMISQPIIMIADQRVLVTILAHTSGQWIKGEILLPIFSGDMKELGGAITYMKRYAYCSILSITAEDDVDALDNENGPITFSTPNDEGITDKQKGLLSFKLKQYPDLEEPIMKAYNLKNVYDIGKQQFQKVMDGFGKRDAEAKEAK